MNKMKHIIIVIGLILVFQFSLLYIYQRGLIDGKINYQHSKNMQLALDSAYQYGFNDGWNVGFDQANDGWFKMWKSHLQESHSKGKKVKGK